MFRLLKPRQCIFVGPWCPIGSRWPCSRILSAHSLAATPVSTPLSRALLNSRRIWKFVIVDELKFEKLEPQQDSNLLFHFRGVLSVYTIRLAERMSERLRTPKTPPTQNSSVLILTPQGGVSPIQGSSEYLIGTHQ